MTQDEIMAVADVLKVILASNNIMLPLGGELRRRVAILADMLRNGLEEKEESSLAPERIAQLVAREKAALGFITAVTDMEGASRVECKQFESNFYRS